jgi:hypothetical protein
MIVDLDGLDVGQPAPFGLVHGVAHVVAGHRTFPAYVATLGHLESLPILVKGSATDSGGQPEKHTMLGARMQTAFSRSFRHRYVSEKKVCPAT